MPPGVAGNSSGVAAARVRANRSTNVGTRSSSSATSSGLQPRASRDLLDHLVVHQAPAERTRDSLGDLGPTRAVLAGDGDEHVTQATPPSPCAARGNCLQAITAATTKHTASPEPDRRAHPEMLGYPAGLK